MEFLFILIHKFSAMIVEHLIYSAIGAIVLLCVLLRFYCKLTLGVFISDHDMTGKTVLITGASDGIGRETALDLARRNARVLMACRNPEKANKVAEDIRAATGNPNVIVKSLELSSFASVRKCADDVLKNEEKLDLLINNAGIGGVPRQITEDGCELIMQTNHFGHFLLTSLLLDLLKKSSPSRIINVSSAGHLLAKLDVNDLTNKAGLRPIIAYCNSKLANILFTKELARRLDGTGVTVNALHPGCVKTAFFRDRKDIVTLLNKALFEIVGKTSREGAQTTIKLAVDPDLEKTTGRYFADCKEGRISKSAVDRSLARRLYELSEEIVGLK